MKAQKQALIPLFFLLLISCCFLLAFSSKEKKEESALDLVKNSTWYIAGPAVENQETINKVRLENGIVKVTANENPKGEIELNVMITPSDSNDGKPTNLPEDSKFVSITYKSSHLIKLQAREGNENGTGCVHGGSHPRVDLSPSPKKFVTLKIPWTNFRQNGLPDGKLLNIHNLCKFNFVNYNPVPGASLEIKSVLIQN
ncbi:hypothetical protein EYY60_12770 [Flavobacterium zhairuonense]|uniref:hypothetical protein n=1 Tax=Flavobacterium zhairuonense TaxID=2493631 RepID=UPI00104D875C|nr:hypothetical protein [Flavobacterium zhairuonense]KAF2509250.1 hypothetical protein EYY60_12770 [Flavobacterium zhairuonense]